VWLVVVGGVVLGGAWWRAERPAGLRAGLRAGLWA